MIKGKILLFTIVLFKNNLFSQLNAGSISVQYKYALYTNAVHVADNRIDKDLLYEIVQALIYGQDYSEELKLKIIHVITT